MYGPTRSLHMSFSTETPPCASAIAGIARTKATKAFDERTRSERGEIRNRRTADLAERPLALRIVEEQERAVARVGVAHERSEVLGLPCAVRSIDFELACLARRD